MAQFIGRCIYGIINLIIAYPIPMFIIIVIFCIFARKRYLKTHPSHKMLEKK